MLSRRQQERPPALRWPELRPFPPAIIQRCSPQLPATPTPIVVDASVAAKWLFPSKSEPLADEANHLLRSYVAGEVRLIVPDLFWAEIDNFLWKSVRLGRCTETTAHEALEALKQRDFPTTASFLLIEAALEIATAFGRTVFDSLYVALAAVSKAQLIAADEKLANALAARLPVKWLGAAQI